MGDNKHGNQGGQGSQGGQGHGGNGGQGNGGQGHGHQGGGQGHGHGGGQGGGQGHEKHTDLGQKVDWMTYSHQQLWEMVNTGVDLKAAGSAQTDWATVGKALGEVQELLAKAISRSTQAWEGESAQRAREALESVEKWALHTSEHADNVAKCIATEIDHVQTAREMMPPPAPAPPVVTPVADVPSTPTPIATPRSPLIARRTEDFGYRTLSPIAEESLIASTRLPRTTPGAFTGIDTVAAPAVDSVLAADATHRQAAEVMAMFQLNSYEVDRTVPSFSPPTNPVAPTPPPQPPVLPTTPTVPDGSGGGAGNPVVANPGGQNPGQRPGGTSPQSGRPGSGGGRSGFTGFGGGGRGAVSMPTPVGSAGGGGASGPLAGPGSATGALGDRGGSANPGSVTSSFQAPKSVTPQAGMIGAAPMAAPPPVAGSGSEDRDRSRPNYLEDDDNVFGVDRKAAPPVIGL
ncbi:hypothetical protein F4560_006765 [Saccharothrix ecbatanensis]|uniref:PPE domain-containing protein n=1 Tax=Saccharothrix ecbatanensis TaxID=1105145 RepID=A0A7W9M4D8_9PSEU|nr:PPE domain-containing protein [Saccharothrix ecbatanensis]MBB5806997.1 hypothetical protein [Saccharothrix ecbatanensis]